MSEPISIEEALESHGRILYTNVGTSMMPLLRERRDVMVIDRPTARLKKYDVPLYKKNGRYVLHRIIKVRENDYVIVGDHCTTLEYGITDADIIGVLTEVIRDGKPVNLSGFTYKLYYHLWCDLFPIRVLILRIKALARAVKRAILGKRKTENETKETDKNG